MTVQVLYESSLAIKSAVPHPRIMGVIRECGGKAHLHERQWELAYQDFWDAFKNYDEGTQTFNNRHICTPSHVTPAKDKYSTIYHV